MNNSNTDTSLKLPTAKKGPKPSTGEEAASPTRLKRLEIEALKSGKPEIRHFYSEAVNKQMKGFRFYVHLSQVGDELPFLWLSHKQYRTLRNGHEFFHRESVTEKQGVVRASWLYCSFRLEPAAGEILITFDHRHKNSWGFVGKFKKSEETLYLLKSNQNYY